MSNDNTTTTAKSEARDSEAKRTIENIVCFKQNDTYLNNYCQSIGNSSKENVIGLESKSFYGNWNFTSPTVSEQPTIKANEVTTNTLKIDNASVSRDYDSLIFSKDTESLKLKFKSESEYASVLSPEELSNSNIVATKGDIGVLKNLATMNVEQTIAFLEIVKFIPELSAKTAQIDALVESLEQSR